MIIIFLLHQIASSNLHRFLMTIVCVCGYGEFYCVHDNIHIMPSGT